MSWRQWSITVLWFAAVLSVVGQTSPVTVTQCSSFGFDWAINSKNQTPCLVAAYLESACGEPTNIPEVPLGNHYLGPTASEANLCRCSSVTYSAISACAGCQNRAYVSWLTWNQDCPDSEVFLTIFPPNGSLSSAVVVPSWAYLDINKTNNNFDVGAAKLNASETSTTSSAVTTSTSIYNSLTPSSTALASATLASASTSAGNPKSNAGAIAGGVVGGIGFVAVVGLGTLLFFLRKKRNKVQQNIAFDRRALVSGTGMSQTRSPRGILPSQQSIYTSDMRSILYPETFFTTPGALRSLENKPPSLYQFGHGPQSDANVSRGHTGVPGFYQLGHGPQSDANVSRGYTRVPGLNQFGPQSDVNVSRGYTGVPGLYQFGPQSDVNVSRGYTRVPGLYQLGHGPQSDVNVSRGYTGVPEI